MSRGAVAGSPQNGVTHAVVSINAHAPIAQVDEDYICATLDWWPSQKCDYGACSWDHASLLDLNLTHPMLRNAVKAFSPLKIRLGGSLQDQVIYNVGKPSTPCISFSQTHSMFGFSGGCLPMGRWNALFNFFQETKAKVAFGVNALYGRHYENGHYAGPWNSSNARDFIQYTVNNGFEMNAWEFGNELSGSGVGTSISAQQYAADVKEFRKIIQEIYSDVRNRPLVIAPDGFFEKSWLEKFLQALGPDVLDIVSIHIYNLGAGVESNLVQKILNYSYLDRQRASFESLHNMLRELGFKIGSWVGEAGGASNSGHHLVTDAFVSNFWYLDQLGMAASIGTKTYCRQSLVGGYYELLNTTNFEPNPDYYSALLWHRLMGGKVLAANSISTPDLRTYAHCSKGEDGITLVVLNLNNSTKYLVSVSIEPAPVTSDGASLKWRLWSLSAVKAMKTFLKARATQSSGSRQEYHLSAKDGDIRSQIATLNGNDLRATHTGDIPNLFPETADISSPISVAPLSIAFVHFPGHSLACS